MYDTAINELNTFLKGQYMGIHAYEHLIQQSSDPFIKHALQHIQQEHKLNTIRVAERIQNLGGIPVTSEGLIGSIEGFISRTIMSDDMDDMIRMVLKGEDYYGIQLSAEMVKGDLDPQSQQLVDEILRHNEKHVQTLKKLLKTD